LRTTKANPSGVDEKSKEAIQAYLEALKEHGETSAIETVQISV
jgi:predicted RNase H-like HicB family nuclease